MQQTQSVIEVVILHGKPVGHGANCGEAETREAIEVAQAASLPGAQEHLWSGGRCSTHGNAPLPKISRIWPACSPLRKANPGPKPEQRSFRAHRTFPGLRKGSPLQRRGHARIPLRVQAFTRHAPVEVRTRRRNFPMSILLQRLSGWRQAAITGSNLPAPRHTARWQWRN